ncbi:MAG: ABC transporter ATP-binding protein, partial [Ktedonobacterales bacterium]|nr:ABC transporter ATP-binding protein [Ktedonobacterales bacterium]
MGFVFDGLEAEEYDRSYGDRVLVRRIADYFRPHFGAMILIVAGVVLGAVLDAVLPILISRGIDNLTHDASNDTLIRLIVAILIAGGLSWTFNFVRQWFSARVVGDVVRKVRLDAFDAVMERDMSFYDEFPSGKVVSRVTSDSDDFSNVVTLTLNLLSQSLLVLIISGVLIHIDPVLALVTLLIAPLIVAIALTFRHLARIITQQARRSMAVVNNTVQETISGISVAKNFRQEGKIYDEFHVVNNQSYRVGLRQGFFFVGLFPVLNTIAGLGTTIVIFVGGNRVLGHNLTPGSWYLFAQAIVIFWFPLTSI